VKKRLDVLLVERGLAESRAQAQALVLAGLVPGFDKPGHQVPEDAELAVDRPPRFVSRGGEKLANALERLEVELDGRDAIDVGASTGGFTDCLLKRGARHVYAVDVGRGQLHPRLGSDPRVTALEGVNARDLDPSRFDPPPTLATLDVSFISLEKVLPAVAACLAAAGVNEIVALVKPQFEVGRGQVGKGGVVRDPQRHREVLLRLADFAATHALGPRGVVASPLRGPKGNREFFLYLHPGGQAIAWERIEAAVAEAVGG
jgi:23S rRNA (cytidine1920-2'-O)/16S rRNA (cytidine1409-2'-O)-methyltransferase